MMKKEKARGSERARRHVPQQHHRKAKNTSTHAPINRYNASVPAAPPASGLSFSTVEAYHSSTPGTASPRVQQQHTIVCAASEGKGQERGGCGAGKEGGRGSAMV
jgi:hypothetical protein